MKFPVGAIVRLNSGSIILQVATIPVGEGRQISVQWWHPKKRKICSMRACEDCFYLAEPTYTTVLGD
jgi:hypothetical protein